MQCPDESTCWIQRVKYELEVSSQMENLAAIGEFVTAAVTDLGLDEEKAFAVQMAVDEACTNVIEHAYAGRVDGIIHVTCHLLDDDVVVKIRDFGQPFDPDAVLPPDLDAPIEEQEERCLGLFLMRKLMDSVRFRFDAVNGNVLTMTKRRHGADPLLCK